MIVQNKNKSYNQHQSSKQRIRGSFLSENEQQDRLPVTSTSVPQQKKPPVGSLGSFHRSLPFKGESFKAGILRSKLYVLETENTTFHPQNHDEVSFYKTQSEAVQYTPGTELECTARKTII